MHQHLAYDYVHHCDHDLRSDPRFPADVSSQPLHARLETSEGQILASVDAGEPGTATPSSKSRSDRSVNSGRVISRRRDASSAQAYQAFAQDRPRASHGVGVVYKGKTYFSSSHTEGENDNQKTDDDVLEDLLADLSTAPKSIVTSYPHWSSQWIGHPTTHRVCAEWRDLSDYMKLDAAFYTTLEAGKVYAVTLHLNDAEEAKARDADDAADRIYPRLCRRLGEVQDVVMFAMAVEDRTSDKKRSQAFERERRFERKKKALAKLLKHDDRRVHLHGFIVIADHEKKNVEKALKLAGGSGRGRQLILKPAYSVGWASYMMKNAHFSSPRLRPVLAGTPWAPRFKGEVMRMSGALRRLAKAHYEAFRADQKAKSGRKPRASRVSRRPSVRWMTDVRAMLGSTMLTPLTMGAPVQSRSISSVAVRGARPTAGRALWVPSKVSVTRPVARASRCARRRARIVARHAVGRQVNGFVRKAA